MGFESVLYRAAWIAIFAAFPCQAQTKQFELPASQQWLDTGIDLQPGARIAITASGSIQYANAAQAANPDGLPRSWKDLMRVLPVNGSGRGALIGKIGADAAAEPFLVGSKRELKTVEGGRLSLGINQGSTETGDGSYQATVQILDPGSASRAIAFSPESAKALDVPGIKAGLFSKIPRRVSDQAGDPGDMVNFLILGSEEQMRQTFQTAGWMVVDRTKKMP